MVDKNPLVLDTEDLFTERNEPTRPGAKAGTTLPQCSNHPFYIREHTVFPPLPSSPVLPEIALGSTGREKPMSTQACM